MKRLLNILTQHGIDHSVHDNRVYALDVQIQGNVVHNIWVDVTDINIMQWLGY